jgi:hypothetical protein
LRYRSRFLATLNGGADMQDSRTQAKGYLLAAVLGAVGGGLSVALVSRIVPRLMSQAMSSRMRDKMAQMVADGCDPAEM